MRPVIRAGICVFHQSPELLSFRVAVVKAQMHPVHQDVRQCDDSDADGTEPEDVPEKYADEAPSQGVTGVKGVTGVRESLGSGLTFGHFMVFSLHGS